MTGGINAFTVTDVHNEFYGTDRMLEALNRGKNVTCETLLRMTQMNIAVDEIFSNIALSVEKRDIGGLGIFMVKKPMDTVEYEYHDDLNILILT